MSSKRKKMENKRTSAEEYDLKIAKIKRKLSSFNRVSILNAALSHLHHGANQEIPASGMPWIILFALKLAMLECKENGRNIKNKEFQEIADSIFQIQHLASDISEGDAMLKMRAMIIQQAWYQRPLNQNAATLIRQLYWFTGANNFYNDEFEKTYGISLYNFYSLSIYITVRTEKSNNGISSINIHELLFFFYPTIPIIQIRNYFTLTAVRAQDLKVFFENFRLNDEKNQQSEYFQPSPLRLRPILIDGNRALIPNKSLFTGGISALVPEILKRKLKEEFKTQFGKDMEDHVGKLLDSTDLKYINEKAILKIYSKNNIRKGKVADYLISENENILIECKAIEPGDIVQSSHNTETLYKHLEDSFIKAINQVQETAFSLKKTKEFKEKNFKAIITTHEDFWFATAEDVNSLLKKNISLNHSEKYGNIPIPLSDIIFLPIATLESVISLHNDKETSFERCILECIQHLSTPEGKRFTASHAISDLQQGKGRAHELIMEPSNQWLATLPSVFDAGKHYWQRNPLSLLRAHEILFQSINNQLIKGTNATAGLPVKISNTLGFKNFQKGQ